MLTLHQIAERLQDRTITKVSEATGINRNLLKQFKDNAATNPMYATVKTLSDYLEAN